jgi:hypothetical protein
MFAAQTPGQVNHEVRPDSMLILHAAKEVVEEEGFDELLESVQDRIDEIESLHRTRELTVSRNLDCQLCFISQSVWWLVSKRVSSSRILTRETRLGCLSIKVERGLSKIESVVFMRSFKFFLHSLDSFIFLFRGICVLTCRKRINSDPSRV